MRFFQKSETDHHYSFISDNSIPWRKSNDIVSPKGKELGYRLLHDKVVAKEWKKTDKVEEHDLSEKGH